MEDNVEFYNKLYEILATLQYNSERREILENVLRIFLVKKDSDIDITAEARKKYAEKEEQIKIEKIRNELISRSEWFKQEYLLLSNISHEYIPEYVIQKFSPFAKEFEEAYGFDMNTLWKFAFKIWEYVEFKKYMTRFTGEVYKFRSKKEYADLGFIAIPSKTYIEKWKNIANLSISEIERILSGIMSINEVKEVLRILSISLNKLPEDYEMLRFSSTPLLQIDKNTLVLLTPWYLTRALPSIYESLFKKCKSYLESKGKSFEKLSQNTLKALPFEALAFNVYYGNNFETDAIISFKKSHWITEISSHPLSLKSLQGNISAIDRDLRNTIKKCMVQGRRCLEHLNEISFCLSKNAKTKGILIIVDGVYPQLNMNTFINFFKEKIPIYVINWFDLRVLIDQPEIENFENFLLWRTQQPMPVVSFDEKDYWAFYFDYYEQDNEMKKSFETMKEKYLGCFYISYRFNKKDYLEKLAVGD